MSLIFVGQKLMFFLLKVVVISVFRSKIFFLSLFEPSVMDIQNHFITANAIELGRNMQSTAKNLNREEREWLFENTRGECKNALVHERFLERFGRVISISCVGLYKGMKDLNEMGSRGLHNILNDQESSLLLRVFDQLREQSIPIYASLIASVARGIKEGCSPRSTTLNGGCLKFSSSWAKDWMKRNNIRVRHATSDRTVTPGEVIESSKKFFSQLEVFKGNMR